MSLFPTLLELCGLPKEEHHDGPSLVPLLKNTSADWPHTSTTYLAEPGSFGLSDEQWRYIHYANGDEELYHTESDPYEWSNLAERPQHAEQLNRLRNLSPKSFAPMAEPNDHSLTKLSWVRHSDKQAPASKPNGAAFDVVFRNTSATTVKLFWMNTQGDRKFYADIEPNRKRRQQTRHGAVWLITNANEQPLGHFAVEDQTAQAIIPGE